MMIDYPSDSLASCNFSIVFQKHTMIVCVKILCLSGAHQDMFFSVYRCHLLTNCNRIWCESINYWHCVRSL